jgi:hypothetical protein
MSSSRQDASPFQSAKAFEVTSRVQELEDQNYDSYTAEELPSQTPRPCRAIEQYLTATSPATARNSSSCRERLDEVDNLTPKVVDPNRYDLLTGKFLSDFVWVN